MPDGITSFYGVTLPLSLIHCHRFVSKFHSAPESLKQLKRSFRERPVEGANKEDEEVMLEELDLERFSSVAKNASSHSSSSVILYQGPNSKEKKSCRKSRWNSCWESWGLFHKIGSQREPHISSPWEPQLQREPVLWNTYYFLSCDSQWEPQLRVVVLLWSCCSQREPQFRQVFNENRKKVLIENHPKVAKTTNLHFRWEPIIWNSPLVSKNIRQDHKYHDFTVPKFFS